MTPPKFSAPRFSANDWPRLGDMVSVLMTVLMLLAWLLALAVAWVHWTKRSELESVVLLALAVGVVLMAVGFVRSLYRQRQRYARLARDGAWQVATVTDIGRGHDPAGIAIGVPFRWIVTATAVDPSGTTQVFHSAPIRRLRDVRNLLGKPVWVRLDPADPACHVLFPRAPAA